MDLRLNPLSISSVDVRLRQRPRTATKARRTPETAQEIVSISKTLMNQNDVDPVQIIGGVANIYLP